MTRNDLQPLFDYHYWAHRRVWECLMRLTDDQFNQDLGYSVGSLIRQCVHTMNTERFWLDVARGTLPENWQAVYNPDSYQTRDQIRPQWDTIERETRAYLSEVSNDDLAANIYYHFPWTQDEKHPRWQALMYIVTHGIDHRAQIMAGCHQLGGSTTNQDFIRYIWETHA